MPLFISLLMFIVVAILSVGFLLMRDRGSKEPVGALWMAFGYGIVALIVTLALEQTLLPKAALHGSAGSLTLATLLTFIGVGVIEESSKFLPLARYIYKQPYFNEHTDGIIYFFISGMTFGLVENVAYTLSLGTKAALVRLLLVPLFHGATTAIAGFFLARAKLEGRSLRQTGIVLAGLMLLHGFYDFGLFSQLIIFVVMSLMITAVLTLGLFLFYMKAKELDLAAGLAASGKNSFCRSCGRPNKARTVYCEYCGHKT